MLSTPSLTMGVSGTRSSAGSFVTNLQVTTTSVSGGEGSAIVH